MKTTVLQHTADQGWSAPFPALDGDNTLVAVFGPHRTAEAEPRIRDVLGAYPESVVIGCSTAGEIFMDRVSEDSTVAGIISFDSSTLRVAYRIIEDISHSREMGAQLGRAVNDPDLKGVFVLSEGLNVNGSELVAGLGSVLDPEVVVSGGLAGDGAEFEATWVLADGEIRENCVVVVGFYGENLVMRSGHQGGWDIFGPERRVTRSEANVVYELDGMPALDLYERYLGDLAAELPSSGLLYPLAVWKDDREPLVRTLLAIDREKRSMTFAGNVEEGAWAQLMQASTRGLVDGASSAVFNAGSIEGAEVACIAISCVGRKLVMGSQTARETEATLESLPAGTSQVGFYSYGEISAGGITNCELHNQTMTVTVFAER